MPKVGMAPVRRRQLISATIDAIHQHGLADTTVARIAANAGVSTGIVHHYFTGKDELLFEVMRAMLSELREEVLRRLQTAETPHARLHAIIEACFDDSQFSPAVMSAWLALYGSARQSAPLARIVTLYHKRLESNLTDALRPLTSNEAPQIAAGIAAMIDGIWLRAALRGETAGAERSRRIVTGYAEIMISTHAPGT